MKKESEGLCVLAGAGPGDLGLVTLRAREAVEQAQVVVYDYLCNPQILQWAPADAEILFAGKKSGQHTLRQEEINQFLVDKTREGKRVVRLKGGDPFVFGRGGEEAEALAAAGLTFEIVPGISSAIAVPAYAGIPLTHREFASSFTVFTGHEDPAKKDSTLDYQALAAGSGTLVMLMGTDRLALIVPELLANGADPHLPAALIRWGTTGRQETLIAELGSIVAASAGFHPPAIAVFGRVVELRDRLRWFERRPLFGRRIVVTRTRKQAGALAAKLRVLGADVYEIPTIRIEPPENLMEFGELVRDAFQYDWLIFTSVNGVDAFFDMFYRLYEDARSIGNVKIAAIGPVTAQRVKNLHLCVDLQPKEFIAEAIIEGLEEFGSVENLKFLVVRASNAREVLPQRLTQLGAIVDEAIAYRTVPETQDASGALERFRAEGADLVTFTSSSTVENFLALKLPWPPEMKTASIGPITSETMRENRLPVDVEAARYDIEGLVEAVLDLYGSQA
ncbi:MAG: uroporphyrinogen-III C-methyltransferase, partial [Verrucomicrobia bacterium]|nr:uroporphyrinogen-III C-methyltransferase [Verrucomicrobiota bacterium]